MLPVLLEKNIYKFDKRQSTLPQIDYLQPVHLIAVESKEGLEKISKGANIYNAPLAIIVCADHNKAWVRPFDQKQTGDIDAAILTDHMMLEATELGLPYSVHSADC